VHRALARTTDHLAGLRRAGTAELRLAGTNRAKYGLARSRRSWPGLEARSRSSWRRRRSPLLGLEASQHVRTGWDNWPRRRLTDEPGRALGTRRNRRTGCQIRGTRRRGRPRNRRARNRRGRCRRSRSRKHDVSRRRGRRRYGLRCGRSGRPRWASHGRSRRTSRTLLGNGRALPDGFTRKRLPRASRRKAGPHWTCDWRRRSRQRSVHRPRRSSS